MATDSTNGAGGLLAQASQPFTISLFYGGTKYNFPVRLYLSEEWASRREASIGASPEEKGAIMRNFKTEIVADVLAGVPTFGGGETLEQQIPDFPPAEVGADATPPEKKADLYRRAKAFFDSRDGAGNQILWFIVEYIFREYWERALPGSFPPAVTNTGKAVDLSQQTP